MVCAPALAGVDYGIAWNRACRSLAAGSVEMKHSSIEKPPDQLTAAELASAEAPGDRDLSASADDEEHSPSWPDCSGRSASRRLARVVGSLVEPAVVESADERFD